MLFGESDQLINQKVRAIVANGMTPVLCVGENSSQKEDGVTKEVVTGQVLQGLDGLSADEVGRAVVAYEPVWAIGSGKTATPEDAEEVAQAIRAAVAETWSREAPDRASHSLRRQRQAGQHRVVRPGAGYRRRARGRREPGRGVVCGHGGGHQGGARMSEFVRKPRPNGRGPVALIILDGFGLSPHHEGNAVYLAKTPNFDHYWETYPHTTLQASGEAVGLPDGQFGNSEVGHSNIGAGRVLYQDLTRITKAIREGDFFQNEVLVRAMDLAVRRKKTLHICGLVSDGGVHSHIDHLFALLRMAAGRKVPRVVVHAFLDGRDTPPTTGVGYLNELQQLDGRSADGRDRDRGGPVLRDGPRQALGARQAGVRRDGVRRGRSPRAT